jgi:hypothetical protein
MFFKSNIFLKILEKAIRFWECFTHIEYNKVIIVNNEKLFIFVSKFEIYKNILFVKLTKTNYYERIME